MPTKPTNITRQFKSQKRVFEFEKSSFVLLVLFKGEHWRLPTTRTRKQLATKNAETTDDSFSDALLYVRTKLSF